MTEQLRVCGTRTKHGDCIFHRWIETEDKVVGLVETAHGRLVTLPWEWIYFYDSEKYLMRCP
jgi:hypothetical protein